MDQETLQKLENERNDRLFSDGTCKMDAQSKQSLMIGWAVQKDGGASKAIFI